MAGAPADLDPVPLEVLKSAFVSVCNEMALAVEMSAYPLIISEERDFSATLYDVGGQLVSDGDYRVGGEVTSRLRTEMFGAESAEVPLLADEASSSGASEAAGERRVGAQARPDR